MSAIQEHGVHDDAGEDYFVLLRVNGEIRYFAGKKGPSYGTADYEMGVIETPAAALSFGNEYLVDRRNLAEIRVQRKIVNASRFE